MRGIEMAPNIKTVIAMGIFAFTISMAIAYVDAVQHMEGLV